MDVGREDGRAAGPRKPAAGPADPSQLEADLLRAFAALSEPAVIVETSRHLVCASAVAKRRLAKADGMAVACGRLVGDHPGATKILEAGLSDAALLGDAVAPSSRHEVTLPCRDGRSLRLVLHPLRRGRAVRMLVTFDAVAEPIELDPARVEAFFGLTRTEAELSVALAGGVTVAAFAAERGCSEQTARTHLKHVFDKTACRRQVELVLTLLTNPELRAA